MNSQLSTAISALVLPIKPKSQDQPIDMNLVIGYDTIRLIMGAIGAAIA